MARPVFIICSETGSVDRFTNLISIHNILERITIRKGDGGPIPDGHAPWLSMRVVAVWEADSEDIGSVFEHRMTIHYPGKGEETITEGEFVFKTQKYRFFAAVGGAPPTEDGTLFVTSRIRKKGEVEWLSQEYEVNVEMTQEESVTTGES